MSGFGLVLSILIAVLSLAITVAGMLISDRSRRLKYLGALCSANLVLAVMLLMTNYRDSRQSREQAEEQRRTLEAKVDKLSGQNRTLADQIADCNAQTEAVRKKLHARAHFTRGISENSTTKDSVTGIRNK